ncbi:MAG: hypothetical protein JNM25_15345 [Planctomycetes bacterium]|nr:hypothetical protein [Planctomycetota bacterium]
MSRHEARAVEVALAKLASRLDADPRLHAERLRAQREFFGQGAAGGAERLPTDAAGQRFVEWLLLERESEVLGAPPIDVPPFAEEGRDLVDSTVGVFLVLARDAETVEAQDLQDDTVFDLSVPAGSLLAGDLLVGRLFDAGADQWRPSSAAAVFRPGALLAEAFRRDVERLALHRRLRQIELEHLLLRRTDQTPSPTAANVDTVPLEHLEADLDALLRASGCRQSAAEVSSQLRAVERPGAVIGPLLEELAFETDIDLDATREILLRIWNAHHGNRPPGPVAATMEAAASESLGEQLVRTLDEGLRQKRDVEDLFAQLERMAGIEAEEEAELEHAGPDRDEAGDRGFESDRDEVDDHDAAIADRGGNLDGDLEPLVQEYLWETDREHDAGAGVLRQWIELQRNAAVPRTDLEQVRGADLLRLLVHCYLGAEPGRRTVVVRSAFAELQRFYAWVVQTQELDLTSVLQECGPTFVDQVERYEAAGLALSTAGGVRARPAILAVDDLGAAGFGVRDDEGEHHWLMAPATTTARLRVGDLVLGALEPGAGGVALAGLVVVLPGAVRSLME